MVPHRPFDPSLLDAIEQSVVESAREAGDNLVVFVNNMVPSDAMEPVSREVYAPADQGGSDQ